MDSMKLFWGLIVLSLGFVLVGVNQGWIASSVWISIFSLWPIILIAVGLKLLIKNEKLLSVLTIGLVLLATIFVALSYDKNNISLLGGWNMKNIGINNQLYSESLTDTFDKGIIKNAEVKVSTGAVSLNIKPLPDDVSKDVLYQVKTTEMGKIELVKKITNDTVTLEIKETQSGMHFSRPVTDRQINIYLPKSLLIKLNVDSGASKVNFDFSNLNITTSEINIGASSGDVYFSDSVKRQTLDLNAGASSLVFHIPSTVGVDATLDGGLNTVNTDSSLALTKNDDRYITKDFANKAVQIVINGTTGVSSIKFQAN